MSREAIKFSLRFKFILLISAMFFLMALMLSLFFFTRTQNLLHDKLIEKGTILVNDLVYNSIYGISIGDAEVVDILIQGIIEQPDVSFVVVYDPDGKEIAVKDLAQTRWPLPRDEMPRILEANGPRVSLHVSPKGESFYEITAPVARKEQNSLPTAGGIGIPGDASSRETVIGVVRIGLSLKAMNQELRKILWFSLLLTGGVIGIGMVITAFFIRRIIQPASEMALAATRISDGDFTWEVQVRSRDEVGILGNSFNRMLSNLKAVIGKIQEASNQIVSTARQLGLSSNNVTEGAQVQAKSIESISTSIEEINAAIREVARTIDLLSSSSEAASSSVLQMDASIHEVAKNTGTLESAIEETSS
ncbi:MAG: methyl-accepting chemotaxis protein, partial [Nitrospirae bacterium]|nr:methyl-accepting chemotaxis protein [Nitrospirota bacterium]